jgi:predicted ribosomally synthesized peptide with SipW-like signal peptide
MKKEYKQVKKVLFALVAVVLAIGMVGSAFAYFTDTVNSNTNVMTAGTLAVSIADNNEPASLIAVSHSFDLSGMAPGNTYETGAVLLQNTGSINIPALYGRFGNLSNYAFGDQLKLAYYATSIDGANWIYQSFLDGAIFNNGTILPTDGTIAAPGGSANADAYINFWNFTTPFVSAGITHSGFITLTDLVRAQNSGSGDGITSLLFLDYRSNPSNGWAHGQTLQIKFGFLFVPEATNAYQGASLTFAVNFIASGNLQYPDTSLASYVNLGSLVS